MKLRRLAVRRLPGIAGPGFEIDRFGDGVNVVVGPNASGKTSLLRAVRAALYAEELAGESVHVEAGFSAGDASPHTLEVTRVGGAPTWMQDGGRAGAPPPLPDHRFVSCYTLHLEDLLASDAGTDQEIALRIAREVAGGYDLEAARRDCGFALPPRIGGTEARESAAAEDALRGLQHERRALAHEEERLPALDRARRAAEEAGRQTVLVDRALRLLEACRERHGLELRRAALPPEMDRLTGAEAESLAGLRTERRDAAERLLRAETEQRTAERALTASGLAGRDLGEGSIAEVRPLLDRLRRLEDDADRERTGGTEAAARRGRAVEALGGEPGRGRARLEPETIRAVERALDTSRRIAAELRAAAAMLEQLPGPEAPDNASQPPHPQPHPDPGRDPDRLRDARRELLRWRSAAAGAHGAAGAGRLALLVGLAAAAATGGALSGLLVHPAGFGLLAVAAALAGAGWLLRARDGGSPQREEAERRYRALGVGPPARWDPESVEARLVEVDGALVDALRHADEGRRRADAERKQEGLRADFERARAEIAALARRVNFDPETLDGSFERWLRLTEQYDLADSALHESEARLAALGREADAARTRIASFLAEHGEAPGAPAPEPEAGNGEPPASGTVGGAAFVLGRNGAETQGSETPGEGSLAGGPSGPEEAAGAASGSGSEAPAVTAHGRAPPAAEALGRRLDRLAERLRQRDEARRAIAAAEESRERLAGVVASRDAAIAALFEGTGLGLDEEAELHRRLGLLEEWRSLDRRLAEVRGAEDLLRGELAGSPDYLLHVDAGDEPALLRRRDALREQTEGAQALAEESATIRTLVDQASRGRDLEHARAVRQRAEEALRARYDESVLADAGAFLLDRIEEEYVNSSRPAVLRQAEDWFARFTRHRFALEVAAAGNGGDSGAFRARETQTGERRALSALSSGTRMQLLLAVRIAFALEAERGRTPLPLFLDETLTTADPERYRAAVESLRRLAEEDGRQIFYLTAQPDEAAYWAAARPNVIDLAEWRRTGRAVARPSEVELPPAPPEPPRVGGRSPEEYAVLIEAAPIDPWDPPAGIHLFHLLRDDLDLLRRLLGADVDRLGPLASLLASGEAGLVLSEPEGSALRRRITGAEAWVEAWREGRGRPVDRGALEASGALTGRFLPDVSALAESSAGGARALLQALDEGAVPRFRARSRRRLEEWFADHGYLAGGAPLDRAGLERRVGAALLADGASAAVARDEAARLVRALTAGLPKREAGAGGDEGGANADGASADEAGDGGAGER